MIRNFRQKNLNLLVATSVLEEGVDVRHCNCVIRFDPPKNFRSFVQSKGKTNCKLQRYFKIVKRATYILGRARKVGSKFYILVEEKEVEAYQSEIKDYSKMEAVRKPMKAFSYLIRFRKFQSFRHFCVTVIQEEIHLQKRWICV